MLRNNSCEWNRSYITKSDQRLNGGSKSSRIQNHPTSWNIGMQYWEIIPSLTYRLLYDVSELRRLIEQSVIPTQFIFTCILQPNKIYLSWSFWFSSQYFLPSSFDAMVPGLKDSRFSQTDIRFREFPALQPDFNLNVHNQCDSMGFTSDRFWLFFPSGHQL